MKIQHHISQWRSLTSGPDSWSWAAIDHQSWATLWLQRKFRRWTWQLGNSHRYDDMFSLQRTCSLGWDVTSLLWAISTSGWLQWYNTTRWVSYDSAFSRISNTWSYDNKHGVTATWRVSWGLVYRELNTLHKGTVLQLAPVRSKPSEQYDCYPASAKSRELQRSSCCEVSS